MTEPQATPDRFPRIKLIFRSLWKETVIAILAAVVGALVTALIEPPLREWREHQASVKKRDVLEITNLNIVPTEWDATWEYEDGSPSLRDKVTFSNWTKDNFFAGCGIIKYPLKTYQYTIRGEASQNRVILLAYKAQDYPTEANIGSATLQLSGEADELTGTWTGLQPRKQADGTEVLQLRSGKVSMHRLRNSNPRDCQ